LVGRPPPVRGISAPSAPLLPDAPALSTITVREDVALPLLISGQAPEPQAIDALLELLRTAAHQDGIAVILFTRDPEVAAAADRSVRIEDGGVEAEIGARGLVAA
jgi:ABC-type thiamine transport system ATPase subunit